MATFADQSAIAIANVGLFDTVERQKAELARFVSPEVAALVSRDEGAQLLGSSRLHQCRLLRLAAPAGLPASCTPGASLT